MSYGIFNYENDEIGTCMMLIYDLEEQGSQQKNSATTNNKGSGYKLESDYSIKSKNSEETTNRKQRPMSGMSYQKKTNDTNIGFSNSKQSDYNFFGSPQQFNGVQNQSTPYIQQNNANNNNFNSNIFTQTSQSIQQYPVTQNISYQNGNQQFLPGQKPQNIQQQAQQQQTLQQQHVIQQNNEGNQYQNFAKMMKNMDEDTFKTFLQQYQMEQQFGKQKNNFL